MLTGTTYSREESLLLQPIVKEMLKGNHNKASKMIKRISCNNDIQAKRILLYCSDHVRKYNTHQLVRAQNVMVDHMKIIENISENSSRSPVPSSPTRTLSSFQGSESHSHISYISPVPSSPYSVTSTLNLSPEPTSPHSTATTPFSPHIKSSRSFTPSYNSFPSPTQNVEVTLFEGKSEHKMKSRTKGCCRIS